MANDGKTAEGYVHDALKLLERTKKSTFLRLYDSRSAGFGGGGNLIPPQPSDFIFALNGRTSLLEVKSSEKHRSLIECSLRSMFSEEQMLGAKLWTRAGDLARVAFYSLETGRFEIWDTLAVREAYYAPPRQRKLQGPCIIGSSKDDESLAYALAFCLNNP